MGFFSAGSTTVVASSIYNLAGDVKDRPNFLKTTVLSGVINDSDSLGETIRDGYRNGPGMTLRNFSKWAAGSSGYAEKVGFVSGQISTGNRLDAHLLAQQIPSAAGETVSIQSMDLGYGDISWWAEQYILSHRPELIETDWHADYLMGQCYITYADRSVDVFVPEGFDPQARYLFAAYTLDTGKVDGPVVPGQTVNVGTGAFPSTVGWALVSSTLTPVTLQLSATTVQGMDTVNVFQQTSYLGIDLANRSRTHSSRQIMTQTENVVAAGNTTAISRSYRIDTQDITNTVSSGLKVFIYASGSGNAVLDAMFAAPKDMGSFFPYIPVRINNRMVSPSYQPEVYTAAKRAYLKATGGRFNKLIDKINDNQSIGDIDYAYVVFGVSANVEEPTAKKYMWAFFESIMESASFDFRAYSRFKTQWELADASQKAYLAWADANGGVGMQATKPPVLIPYPALPWQSIEMKTSGTKNLNFNMKISWNGVEPASGAGMADATHKVGDIWWTINGSDIYTKSLRPGNDLAQVINLSTQVSSVTLWWQVDANNWKSLTLYGLVHQNFIYDGKSVDIGITDAINDREESGFIIPLHEEIFRSTGLKDSTQMATACVYMVFNCYQVVKKKWYQSWWFSVIMIIIIIVITWLTWGTGTGPATSAYGAIGGAIGLSGTAAVIAGIAISMIAAMVLSKVLGLIAKAAFGDKVGAIVGAIATVVIMVVGMNMAAGGSWTTALSQLTEPATLLTITNAIGQGVNEYMAVETQDVIKQTTEMLESYNAKQADVQDAYRALGLDNMASFDPMQLTDTGKPTQQHVYEPASSFLNRTLMTGSDIAELTHALISQFTSLTLDPAQTLVT
jgi:hypothetical protein